LETTTTTTTTSKRKEAHSYLNVDSRADRRRDV